MVAPDGYLPQPAFYQGFVEGFKVGTLLHNVILQFVDSCNLCIFGSGVNSAFFTLLSKFENLVGNLIVSNCSANQLAASLIAAAALRSSSMVIAISLILLIAMFSFL